MSRVLTLFTSFACADIFKKWHLNLGGITAQRHCIVNQANFHGIPAHRSLPSSFPNMHHTAYSTRDEVLPKKRKLLLML